MKKRIGVKTHESMLKRLDSQVGDPENKKRLTIEIPVQLHTKLKVTAAKRGETMAEIICAILEEELKDE
jgi:hypothetical protein